MSASCDEPADYALAQASSMRSPSAHSAYGVRDADLCYGITTGHLLHDLQSDYSLHDTEPVRSYANPNFPAHESAFPPLGKPRAKIRISKSDLSVAALSLACLAMAIIAVANEAVSWRLGVANNQLIVVGFLLSIMNLCLGSVTSTFFLLAEARFGFSILQNYDGILRNKPTAPKLGLPWRVILTLFIILPIAVSVAYKAFKEGQSSKSVKSVQYVSIPTYYGMVAAPGLMFTDQRPTGLPQFFNATQIFRTLSSPANGSEPQLPGFPQSYGYNILLLNDSSTAVLDTLQPDFITAVQDVLAVGESWVVNAPVIGTVATSSTSKAVDPAGFDSAFQLACTSGGDANWTSGYMNIWGDNHASFWLLDEKDNRSDQSKQYLAFVPQYAQFIDCSALLPHVQLYNVYRQQCQGTWSITRAGIELANGSCHGGPLSVDKQQMIVENTLKLTEFYMPVLLDFLAPFSPFGSRNQSNWNGPYTATSVAAMVWSRVVALNTDYAPLSAAWGYNASAAASGNWTTSDGTPLTFEDITLLYPVSSSDETMFYLRPTLRKSPLFYFVLAVQPLLTVAILGFVFTMHSVPLDKGYGLVSILSGIYLHTLHILSGASLSGELKILSSS